MEQQGLKRVARRKTRPVEVGKLSEQSRGRRQKATLGRSVAGRIRRVEEAEENVAASGRIRGVKTLVPLFQTRNSIDVEIKRKGSGFCLALRFFWGGIQKEDCERGEKQGTQKSEREKEKPAHGGRMREVNFKRARRRS